MSKVYLIIGSIGSGKSTIADYLCSTPLLRDIEYIGSDIYKRQYFDDNVLHNKRGYRCSDELAFSRMERVCSSGKDIIFELCPTNPNKMRVLKTICQRMNYNIVSFFVGTDTVDINIERCQERIISGADPVDEIKVKKRYYSSFKHVLEVVRMSSQVYFIDNSSSVPSIVARVMQNKISVYDETCSWLKEHVTEKLL